MNKKLRIGDKIKWCGDMSLESGLTYTILNIDTSRPPKEINEFGVVKEEVLFSWEKNGIEQSMWAYDYNELNEYLHTGIIYLVNTDITPRKDIVNFNFTR